MNHRPFSSGDPGAAAEAEQGGGHDLPGLPRRGREQLRGGLGGGRGLHRLQARKQGRGHGRLRGAPGMVKKMQVFLNLVIL